MERRATRTFNMKIVGKIDKWDINDIKYKIEEWIDDEDLVIEIEEEEVER